MNEFAQKINEAAQTAKDKGQDAALANIFDVLVCKSCHKVYREEKKE
jgi:cytochrome c556